MSKDRLFPPVAAAALLAAACATGPGTPSIPPPAPAVEVKKNIPPEPAARVKALQEEVSRLGQLREGESAEHRRRLAAVERERDLAVAEVVRTRARMQGMASAAEAGAMFAESRVLVDKMEEDAYSSQARDQLRTARRRLEEGKAELGRDNPGGAAFLFDQLSNIYENFRKGSPRRLTVTAISVDLRATPAASARTVATLYRNDPLEGVAKAEAWVQVRDFSGRKGWVPWEAVR